jgi:hypothetical protein
VFAPLFYRKKNMNSSTDSRQVVGNHVIAKAKYVLVDTDYRRRYGSLWQSQLLEGVVLEVVKEAKEGGSGRCTTFVVASYDLGNKYKTKNLVLSLVQEKPHATTPTDTTSTANATTPTESAPPAPSTPTIETTITPTTTTVPQASITTPTATTTTTTPETTLPSIATPAKPITSPIDNATVTAHGENWYNDPIAVTVDINGTLPTRCWGVKDVFDEVFHKGSHCDSSLSQLEVFKLMIPPAQIILSSFVKPT